MEASEETWAQMMSHNDVDVIVHAGREPDVVTDKAVVERRVDVRLFLAPASDVTRLAALRDLLSIGYDDKVTELVQVPPVPRVRAFVGAAREVQHGLRPHRVVVS